MDIIYVWNFQLVLVIISVYCPTSTACEILLSYLKVDKLLKYSIKVVVMTHCNPHCVLNLTVFLLQITTTTSYSILMLTSTLAFQSKANRDVKNESR